MPIENVNLTRRDIPVYATVLAVAFYTLIHATVISRLHSSGAPLSNLIFFVLPILIRIYLCYKAFREEGWALAAFTILSLYILIKNSFSNNQVSPIFLAADAFLAIFLLLWFITRLREVSRNEIEYGMRSIPKVNLKAPISEAYKLYGEPNGTEVDDRNAEATNYTFTVSEHHEAVISEWKGEMHSITYWSSMSLPGPDLEAIKEHFSEGHGWNLLEKGYWYQRKDGTVRLWCSAAPAIGVGTLEFMTSGSADDETENDETSQIDHANDD